ncbi:MAG: septal ring lytic transglycosylase RlpA family protein [Bauldia sp.]|nr:septal ring lytic transglycosylase RlpA family protein [Bauldia sp.]
MVARQLQRLTRTGWLRAACLMGLGAVLASCSATEQTTTKFSEAEYGKASPRVVTGKKKVPDGGGRYMVGEPYRVAGRTYIPQDNPEGYTATGKASWYGANFHGRKTANGEVFDMADLSAAHPTLPLPSYVRVTNLSNGRSLIVRVNDRGPFSRDRVIDVSSQAASMLDFKRAGTANVKVEYIGRARLDGKDHDMLMASYRGPGAVEPRTMVASNEPRKWPSLLARDKARPTIDFSVADEATAFDGAPAPANLADPIGPLILESGFASSYAEPSAPVQITRAQAAAAAMAAGADASFPAPRALPAPRTVQLGAFSDLANAKRAAARFARYGEPVVSPDSRGRALHVVQVRLVDPSVDPRDVIAAAGQMGLSGAFVVSSSN